MLAEHVSHCGLKVLGSHSVSRLCALTSRNVMAEDIAYADLNIQGIYSFRTAPSPCPDSNTPQSTQWPRVALGVASVVILLLMGTVITLAVFVSVLQNKATLNGTKYLPDSDLWQQLKHFACRAEDVEDCKICPNSWEFHRGKCYWTSKDKTNWTESQADCKAKNSTLPVIQNKDELTFIKNKTNNIWLGLIAKYRENWTWWWVDESLFQEELFPISGPAKENSCGLKREAGVVSETCGSENHWICEKKAFKV